MCLAIPVQVVKLLDQDRAVIALSGVEKEISLALINSEAVEVGDYVIIHVGYAISKLNQADAQKTLAYFDELLANDTL